MKNNTCFWKIALAVIVSASLLISAFAPAAAEEAKNGSENVLLTAKNSRTENTGRRSTLHRDLPRRPGPFRTERLTDLRWAPGSNSKKARQSGTS